MSKIIDYAGLFPPASLELEPAFTNYLNYKNDEYSDMLSKFICPMKLLPRFSEFAVKPENIRAIGSNNIEFSLLPTGGNTENEFFNALKYDIDNIRLFIDKDKFGTSVNTFEIKIPQDVLSVRNTQAVKEFITKASDILSNAVKSTAVIFCEPVFKDENDKILFYAAEAIAESNEENCSNGFKLRTGGVEASAFPVPEKISQTIKTCFDFKIPFKATAGLHHPVRHFNDSVNCKMHGFLNVFTAGILLYKYGFETDTVNAIIKDENPLSFIFGESGMKWNEFEASVEEINYGRKLMVSFGSCSFEEPVEDIKSLNLI